MRVRVIDDDRTLIQLLTVLLDLEEMEPVITGSDFERLFEPEAWESIDAALVDMHLNSTVTGADILGYLVENHPDIRRVAFTGMDLLEGEVSALAHAVVCKPADASEITEALRG